MLRRFKLERRLRSSALFLVAALTVLAAPAIARADAVTQWNANAAITSREEQACSSESA